MKDLVSKKRRLILSGLSIAALASMQKPAMAQRGAWPDHPIKLVVPVAPGGVADAIARRFAKNVAEQLGQQIVVENRPGASTIIGTLAVAKAPPDGYTILLAQTAHIQNPIHFKKVAYDPLKDFTPLGRIGLSATVVVVRPDLGIKNVDEFVKAARGKRWSYGAGSTGPQVILEIFNKENDLGMTGVLYKGESPALTDLLGGQIEMGLFSVFAAKSYLLSGKLTPIAVIGEKRVASLPNVPTFAEQGHNEMSYGGGWYAFLAPANVPPEIAGRLSRAIKAFLDNPVERKYLEDMDVIVNWTNGNAFAPQMRQDMEAWRGMVNRSKVVIDQ
ncbi:Bug family tripartite tricarboxylate transporter substrate binding protein [Cupriavidus sp. 2MCAB6]|uniref:Bug family tripartite tricarboxylate transporter substrate binding protein n=1 Tax=Cupriavidus sp. 2MCAB6 TaxID=3232981 RepID=UPI003F8FAF11